MQGSSVQKKQSLLILLFGFTVLFSMMAPFNSFILYFMLPVLFVIVFIKNPGIIAEKYIIIYGLLVLWFLVAFQYAHSIEAAKTAITVEIACLPCSIICYYLAKTWQNRVSVYVVLILYLFEMLVYLVSTEGGTIAMTNDERRSSELVNANTLGYFSFYATFAFFIITRIRNNSRKRTLIGLIIAASISLYIALITASRQVLLINFPLIAILILCLYKNSFKRNISAIIAPIIILAIFIPIFFSFYDNSLLAERTRSDFSEDTRIELMGLAIALGLQNPIVGVGPGNVTVFTAHGAFSHCTYTELFACCGFPALLLFLILVISFSLSQYSRYKKYKDEMYLYFFVFSIFFIADNLFFVFTDCLPLMEFFFFILGHSEYYYRENHRGLTHIRLREI